MKLSRHESACLTGFKSILYFLTKTTIKPIKDPVEIGMENHYCLGILPQTTNKACKQGEMGKPSFFLSCFGLLLFF